MQSQPHSLLLDLDIQHCETVIISGRRSAMLDTPRRVWRDAGDRLREKELAQARINSRKMNTLWWVIISNGMFVFARGFRHVRLKWLMCIGRLPSRMLNSNSSPTKIDCVGWWAAFILKALLSQQTKKESKAWVRVTASINSHNSPLNRSFAS